MYLTLTLTLKPKVARVDRNKDFALGAKPDGCTKVFVGNVSYEATDDELAELFGKCGDVKMVRWLTHKDSGEFKGCGFIDYYDTAAVDEAVKLTGHMLHGRSIRVDYS
jgi:nucleolin